VILGVLIMVAAWYGVHPTRAATTVNLDQWASTDLAWQNGNLNGNNSRYPEGGIVPFRLAMEGLTTGNHSININYDFTAGGHKAYDFLATWNATNASGMQCAASGGAISSKCPNLGTSSSMPFPSDPFKTDGLTVHGAELYSAVNRRLTIWGGTITSISGPTHSGSAAGNSTANFLVRFRATGSAVLLAWGGHLAQSRYWQMSIGGPRDGAGEVSGAPWHMRTLQLDGSGNKNQDRSIQPSAIVGELGPQALAPPTPTPPPAPRPVAPAPPIAGAPGATPGAPAPGGPGAPNVTIPPTSTLDPASADAGPVPGLAAALVVAGLLSAAAAMAHLVRRRRSPPA
jgi:hypothetical protein